MKRRIFQIAAIVCLLLCRATLAMWVRSEPTVDWLFSPQWANWSGYLGTDRGTGCIQFVSWARTGMARLTEWRVSHSPAVGPRPLDGLHRFLGFAYGK